MLLWNKMSINDYNRAFVDALMGAKKGREPVHLPPEAAAYVVTDYDEHPYGRWYRGDYRVSYPRVAEREAGYRPVENRCYSFTSPPIPEGAEVGNYPNHCFQSAPSVVFPCYPTSLRKYSDKDELEIMLNRAKIPLKR